MKILFLSNAPFCGGFSLGSHHLAEQFLQMGHEVLHVSTPVTPLHVVKPGGLQKIKAALKPAKVKGWHVTDSIPFTLFPYGYSSLLDRLNDFAVLRYLRRGGWDQCDLVLVDQPAFWGVLDKLSATHKVYRPTDIYKYMAVTRHAASEEKILEKVEAVIATSDNILKELKTSLPSCVVNNGVDYGRFARNCVDESRNGCIYIGALDERFDFKAIDFIAAQNPDIRFDLFGPCSCDYSPVVHNIHLKGVVDYSDIPDLMRQYLLGLIPLSHSPANAGRSPMKLYEYLAAGLPVLASDLPGMADANVPGVYYYKDYPDLADKFVLSYRLHSPGESFKYKEAAKEQSWGAKANIILDFTKASSVKQGGI